MFFRPATFQLSTGSPSPWQQSSVHVTMQLTSLNLTPFSLINSPRVCFLQCLGEIVPPPHPEAQMFDHLVPRWRVLFGEVWEVWPSRGNRSLETGLRTQCSSLLSVPSLLPVFSSRDEPSASCSNLLLAVMFPHHDRLLAFFHNPNLFHKPK